MIARQIQVFGKVQGVWYRKSTQIKAHELGLKGTVQNLTDGSVLIFVEGEISVIDQLIEWCKIGPKHAEVEKVEVKTCPIKGLETFEVIRQNTP